MKWRELLMDMLGGLLLVFAAAAIVALSIWAMQFLYELNQMINVF